MKKNRLILTVLVAIVTTTFCQKKEDAIPVARAGRTVAASQTPAAAAAENLLVEVKTLAPEKFEHFFAVNGSVEAVEEAFISSQTSGQIKAIHVQEGRRVKRGVLLVSLNSDITRSAMAEVQNSLDLARTVFRKRQELWDKQIGSEIQYLEAKTSKESLENRLKSLEAQLDMAEIRAPFAGIVDTIYKKAGELAVPGLQLMQLVNLDKIRINAEVAETYLGRIHPGDRIEVGFPTYPDWSLEASISRISQVVSEKNRTVLVQAVLDNSRERMKPNMMVTLQLRDFFAPAALVVPGIVVKNDLSGTYLYKVERQAETTVARKQYVTTGLTEGNRTMIIGGLAAGEQVIVTGYNLVKNGMPVFIQK